MKFTPSSQLAPAVRQADAAPIGANKIMAQPRGESPVAGKLEIKLCSSL